MRFSMKGTKENVALEGGLWEGEKLSFRGAKLKWAQLQGG
jgi:hypothetical protein